MFGRLLLLATLLAWSLHAQQPEAAELQLRSDPPEAQLRPLESLTVQVVFYSGDDDGRARLQLNGAEFTVEDGGGWLSKPFRYQGEESEPFYQPPAKGLASLLFRQAKGRFLLQDAVVYTAPEQPGQYEVRASLNGLTASLTITVSLDVAGVAVAETVDFPEEEPSVHPYRALAEHWAPFIAQETWFTPKADYIARFDHDGDWQGDNNWENCLQGSSQAYVYYAAMETETHWFLIYNIFHARDYSDKCVAGSCHENDNEGLILTVAKDGSPFGGLQAMETLAHNNVYSHTHDRSIRSGLHNIDGPVEFWKESHPLVFIEAGGHGVYGSDGGHGRYDQAADEFTAGTGVTYVYKGRAERPRHVNDRLVGYELLPIYDHWWQRAHEGPGREERTFDAYYPYVPKGDRPRAKYRELAGSFLGRTQSENKAKPFWGWHDNRTRKKGAVATGQWGLDPAYSVSQNLRFLGRFSLDYVYNPYLGVGEPASRSGFARPQLTQAPAAQPRVQTQPVQPAQVAAPRLNSTRSILELHLEAFESAGP